MALTLISAAEVRQLLPMAECIDVMGEAMKAVSDGTVAVPPRVFTPLVDRSGDLGLMPASSAQLGYYGSKVISLHRANPARGLPAIQGFVTLFEHDSGAPVAIVEGAQLTAIRTAAASGLATRLLARHGARSCGIFGTGVQAVTHMDAMLAVRPLQEFRVWARDFRRCEAFAAEQAQRLNLPVVAVAQPQEAAVCDVLCTVTGATQPFLEGRWMQPGAHVNLVGAHTPQAREADSALMAGAKVYVDSVSGALAEAGDIMIPIAEGAMTRGALRGEIGEVLLGSATGRTDEEHITVYKSLGLAAQDLYAAARVLAQAKALGCGVEVALQD